MRMVSTYIVFVVTNLLRRHTAPAAGPEDSRMSTPKYPDQQLQTLWESYLEAREDYLESEGALLAYEQSACEVLRSRPHDFIGKGEKLRRRRDEAQDRFRTAERRFVAFRDAYLLGLPTL